MAVILDDVTYQVLVVFHQSNHRYIWLCSLPPGVQGGHNHAMYLDATIFAHPRITEQDTAEPNSCPLRAYATTLDIRAIRATTCKLNHQYMQYIRAATTPKNRTAAATTLDATTAD